MVYGGTKSNILRQSYAHLETGNQIYGKNRPRKAIEGGYGCFILVQGSENPKSISGAVCGPRPTKNAIFVLSLIGRDRHRTAHRARIQLEAPELAPQEPAQLRVVTSGLAVLNRAS